MTMDSTPQIEQISRLAEGILAPLPGYFRVEVKITPVNNVKVYVDADTGVTIDKLATVNRNLYKKLEESGLFTPDDFSLEVSSPGVEEPLKMLRQYLKNIGRKVEVVQTDGAKKEGKLLQATETGIIIEEEMGRNKNKSLLQTTILFSQIKHAKVCVIF